MTNGIVFGKFMPLHLGHEYLINTAIENMDKVFVVVCSLSNEPIDGELRYQWMVNRYEKLIEEGRVEVFHLKEDWIPQEPKDCDNYDVFYGTWAGTLNALVNYRPIDYVFGSEAYINPVARHLQATPYIVDIDRETFPVSGTACRTNPFANWEYMNPNVRSYFTKKILIIGGESTGKSTLTDNLANFFRESGYKAIGIPEYARDWIDDNLGGDMDRLEFEHITHFGKQQMKLVNHFANEGNMQLVFSDTSAIASIVFQDVYYDNFSLDLSDEVEKEQWDLVLFLQPDVPWVDDGQRNLPHIRHYVNNSISDILDSINQPYFIIRGSDFDKRTEMAKFYVSCILGGY